MPGITNLHQLLKEMKPELNEGTFVFCTVAPAMQPTGITPILTFQEREGRTLILSKRDAEQAGLAYAFPCRMIAINVHSALEAIGFVAAITNCLAERGISSNAVSAFFHDYIFVPCARANDALDALGELSRRADDCLG